MVKEYNRNSEEITEGLYIQTSVWMLGFEKVALFLFKHLFTSHFNDMLTSLPLLSL
jgi:hypothetical protein